MESFPSSCKGWSEKKAAYRFFGNDLVTARKVIKPHRISTLNRIKAHPTLAITPNRECLGIVDYEQWSREKFTHQKSEERKTQRYLILSLFILLIESEKARGNTRCFYKTNHLASNA